MYVFGSQPWNNRRRKRVSFQQDEKLIQEIASRVELTEEDLDALWYTKDEYELSKKSQLFIIKLMDRGMGSLENDDELCPRGLEGRTRAGARRKRKSIEAAWDAVLGEQEKQWDEGRFNSFTLARVYLESAAQSAMAAFLAAKRDEEFVHGNKIALKAPTRAQSQIIPPRVLHRQNSNSSTRSN